MTTSTTSYDYDILHMVLCHKPCKALRDQYSMNTHHITTLYSCYLYCKYIKPTFSIAGLNRFVTSYDNDRLKRYIMRLEEIRFIEKTDPGVIHSRYRMTQLGIDNVITLIDKYRDIAYTYSNKYMIEI